LLLKCEKYFEERRKKTEYDSFVFIGLLTHTKPIYYRCPQLELR